MSQQSNQPYDAPPPAPKKRNLWLLVIVAGWAGALLMFVVFMWAASTFVKNNYGGFGQPAAQKGDAPTIADLNWEPRQVDEITLEAPCEFGPGLNIGAELSDEVRVKVDSMSTYVGLGLPENFIVKIMDVVYMREVVASLEDAVHGTVTDNARRLGDFEPEYESKPIDVSGVEGRRSHYQRAVDGEMIHVETVTICKDRRLWQVEVIHFGDELEPLADRILKSVTIEY